MRVAPTLTLAAGLLLAAAIPAQATFVFPRFYANFEGNQSSNIPFGGAQYRYQQILGDAKGAAINGIKSIAFRRDGVTSATSNGKSLIMTILMGHSSITTASPTFASNYIGAPTTVVTSKAFNLPARSTLPPPRPGPWDVVFPFDITFNYNGTQDLLYELVTSNAAPSGAYYIDFAAEGQTGVSADTNAIGTGCTATGRTTPVTLTSTTSTDRYSAAITFAFRSVNGPATTIGSIFLIGASNPNLPVPGLCGDGKLYTDALYAVPPVSYSNGTWTAPTVQMPWSPAWALFSLYVQSAVIDGGLSNPIKVAVSNGLKVTLPPELFPAFTATRIYSSNNSSSTGTLDIGATITRFDN